MKEKKKKPKKKKQKKTGAPISDTEHISGYVPIPDEEPIYGGPDPYQNNRTY